MKIWQKIGIGFLAVILTNLICFVFLLRSQHNAARYQEMAFQAQEKAQEMNQILADHIRWKVNILVALMAEKSPSVTTDPDRCSLGRFLAKAEPASEEERRLLSAIREPHRAMHMGAQKLQELFKEGYDEKEDEILDTYNKIINPKSKELMAVLDQLEAAYGNFALDAKHRALEAGKTLQNVNLAANVLVILMAIGFGYWVTKSVTLPIKEVASALAVVARGDFTQNMAVRGKDEVAALASSLNSMLGSLRPLIRDVRSGADKITEEADKMKSYSEEAAKGGEEACERAHRMVQHGEALVASVEEESQSIKEISTAVEEISQNTAKANSMTQEAVDMAKESQEIIDRLGSVSQDIQSIIQLIGDIAEQTNLLALNATIEAARAGEAGKGFAVVANEVKELAKQTANSAEDITRKVEAIMTESQAAIRTSGEIDRIISEINDITTTIAAAVEEQTAVMADIASSVDEQRQGALEFIEEAKEADQAAQQAKAAAERNMEYIREMLRLAREFQEHVSAFKC